MYYLRTKPKADAIQFTVDQGLLAESRAGPTYEEIEAARAAHAAAPLHIETVAVVKGEELIFDAMTPAGSSPAKESFVATAPAGSSPGDSSAAAFSESAAKAAARAARSEEMAAIKARMKAGIFDDVEAPSEGCISCGS